MTMTIVITKAETLDVRFPTSLNLDGSDAMNRDPDYSAAYVMLHTNHPELVGHGLTFTIGRGNEWCVAVPLPKNSLIAWWGVIWLRLRLT
jgi:L-fuconate dehydratase